MSQIITPGLASRAYAADPLRVSSQNAGRAAHADNPAGLRGSSGPAFVIELSQAAARAPKGGVGVKNSGSAGPTNGRPGSVEQRAPDITGRVRSNGVYDEDLKDDGVGRREAPLSGRHPQPAYQPAGSVIDIRI